LPLRRNVSPVRIVEYEDVARRYLDDLPINAADVDIVLDYVCSIAKLRPVFFGWRPQLRDPDDDMVLEVAVAAGANIVTFNKGDFIGCERFAIRVLTPAEFLREIGVLR